MFIRNGWWKRPWVQQAQEEIDSTPDMEVLETTTHVRVFVYDDMMSGMRNNQRLWDFNAMEYLGWGYSAKRFMTWMRKPSEVFALPPEEDHLFKRNTPNPAMIMGEIYNIPSAVIPELDKFYENMVRFNRTRLPITVPYNKSATGKDGNTYISHKERYVSLPCWMYVGEPRFWSKRIDVGYEYSPVKLFPVRINNQPRVYSRFTRDQIPVNNKSFYETVDNEKLYQEYIAEELKKIEQASKK